MATFRHKVEIALWSVALAAGFLKVWSHRFEMPASDCLSYLDIARAYQRHDWQTAVNAFWSPLYSWLLWLTFWLIDASLYWESTLVHLLNFVLYVAALASFRFFLRELTSIGRASTSGQAPTPIDGLSPWVWQILSFAICTDALLRMPHLDRAAPDIVVAAIFLLATAILARLSRGQNGWGTYAGLGATLGLGYLAKTALFPLALVFLGCALFATNDWQRTWPRALLAVVVFISTSAPFVAALHQKTGRLTIGDSGKLNYAWHVNRPAGQPPQMLFEFAEPRISATYPPWYDPSYWNQSVRPSFDWRQQMRALSITGRKYLQILSQQMPLALGLLALLLVAANTRAIFRSFASLWPIWLPSLATLSLYALVHVERRYIVAALVVLWSCAFAAVRRPRLDKRQRLVNGLALSVAMILGLIIVHGSSRAIVKISKQPPHQDWETAMSFRREGFLPGDEIAALDLGNLYWAHLSQVRIVAEVRGTASVSKKNNSSVPGFWQISSEAQSEILAKLAKVGVKFLVTETTPPSSQSAAWRRIGNSGYYAQPTPSR